MTGLSGSGKTTLARRVVAVLRANGLRAEHIDGDAVRSAVGQSGFDRASRDQNVAMVGYAASLLQRSGINVVVSLISPYDEARRLARSLCDPFVLVHVSTSLKVCIARDAKGLYAMASFGLIPYFTGVTDPYEAPADAELTIDTEVWEPDDGADIVVAALQEASCSRASR
ncbi:MAG: adenylyl-sulfate kinase [Deltaproteobacteria bacterium]|nr:adenylyl-sulfate kinase [Deltaproteobacteria bacterium]